MWWKLFIFLSFKLIKRINSPRRHLSFIRKYIAIFDKTIKLSNDYTIQKEILGGTQVEIVEKIGLKPKNFIFYLHGGAFLIGLNNLYRKFATLLSTTCEASVVLVDYSLAPENAFPKALDEDVCAYKAFQKRYESLGDLIIAGDSAGGNLAIATLLACKDHYMPMPSCAFIFSGWLDLTLKGESIKKNKFIDPIISADHLDMAVSCYIGEHTKPNNPLVSPLYANLRGLPPLFLQIGTEEILLSDTLAFAKKARKDGVDVTIDKCQSMVHVHPLLFSKEEKSQEVFRRIASFIKDKNTQAKFI